MLWKSTMNMAVLLWHCCPIFVVRSIPETSVNIPSFITTKFPRLSSPALVLGLSPLLHVVFSFSLLFWGLGLTSLLFTFLKYFFPIFFMQISCLFYSPIWRSSIFFTQVDFFLFQKMKNKKSLAQPISIHYPVGPRVFSLFFRFHSYALRSSSWIWVTES